jgi:hypothetical protein
MNINMDSTLLFQSSQDLNLFDVRCTLFFSFWYLEIGCEAMCAGMWAGILGGAVELGGAPDDIRCRAASSLVEMAKARSAAASSWWRSAMASFLTDLSGDGWRKLYGLAIDHGELMDMKEQFKLVGVGDNVVTVPSVKADRRRGLGYDRLSYWRSVRALGGDCTAYECRWGCWEVTVVMSQV